MRSLVTVVSTQFLARACVAAFPLSLLFCARGAVAQTAVQQTAVQQTTVQQTAVATAEVAEPIEYEAEQDCPSRQEFEALLLQKGEASLTLRNTALISAHFRLGREGTNYQGSVDGFSKENRAFERRVTAGSCREAAEALALIWSLILREEVTLAAEPPPPVTPTIEKKETESRDEAADRRPVKSRLWYEARLGFGLDTGKTPENLYSPFATFGLGLRRASLLAPLFRVGAHWSLPTTFAMAGASAQFQLIQARMELCPLRAPLASALRFRLCGIGDFGVLLASGDGTDVTADATAKVGSVGAQLAFESFHTSGFGLELGGFVNAELLKSQFQLTTKTIYETPPFSAGAYATLRFDTHD